ncbi:DUF4249 domain-containing protein [Marinoscillum sp.]|uniref:DUF4249 domain-containing protein n=1 Tax=Marinoscillum sp. TaxID=2024838 RepID=UPI003BAD806A
MKFVLPSIVCFLLYACSGLDDGDFSRVRKVVIEGSIEQGEYPIVYLTYSSGFYEPVDSASLQELVLATARVEVSDGEQSEVLTLFRNAKVYPPFYYRGTELRGEAGKTYTLDVRSGGENYFSETTIPSVTPLDSIWVEPEAERDSLGNLWIRFQDVAGQDNYYRNFVRLKGKEEKYHPAYQSTISDRAFDGQLYEHPVLNLPESFIEIGDDVLFQRGDTIELKFCTIDVHHFDFWRTLERELYLVGNPFGSTGNEVISNIQGSKPALGVWGGYGVTHKTIIFQ